MLGHINYPNYDALTSPLNANGYAPAVKNIYFDGHITSIGAYAFYNLSSLKIIDCGVTQAEWEDMVKGENWDLNTGDYIIIFKSVEIIGYEKLDNNNADYFDQDWIGE